MKKSKLIQTLVLVAVLAVIAGVYFLDDQNVKKQAEQEEKDKELFTLEKDAVQSITVVNAHGTFKAIKDGDVWKMTEPFDAIGDKSLWDNLANNFTASKRQRLIAEQAEDVSAFGLSAPPIQVTIAGENDENATTMLIGDEAPLAGKHYALIKGSSDVVTVGSSLQSTADKTLFQLRDKAVVGFETDDVQRIEVQCDPIAYTVERSGDNKWVLTEPMQGLADESTLRTFLNTIKGAEIKQFIDEAPDMLASYGLSEPATKVVFWTGKPGDPAGWSARALHLGATGLTENIYAMRDGENNVFAISPNEFNDMPTSWGDLRKFKISNMRSWGVKRFSVASAGEIILEASNEASDWIIQQPEQGKADYSAVSDVVRGIVELEATRFVEGATAEYHLDKPDLVISLFGEDGEEETILLSNSVGSDDPSVRSMYYGARQDPLEIYAISSGAIRLLMDKIGQVKVTSPSDENEVETIEDTQ
ncbi:MAG: DUF4340 domain-containing protein [Candidatus Hinthialibacter antarcticus]|nr:DUF4340 domain-containing protein [Candidatus Hinthialibacter antarcticus]